MHDAKTDARLAQVHGRHSRRAVLRRVGGGGVIAIAAYPLGRAGAAAQATPSALPAPLADWVAAWEATDPAGVASFYAEDAVYEDVVSGATFEGRAAIEGYVATFLGVFADATPRFTNVFAAEDRAAAEWTFDGTYTGQFPGFPPGAGERISFRGASFLELRDGLIVRDTEYVDFVAVLRQVGLLPGAATPEAGGMATPSG